MPLKRGAVFAQVGGEYHSNRSSDFHLVGPGQLTNKSTSVGVGFGAGGDFTVTKRLTLRVIQINYVLPFFGEGPGRNVRLKTGVVLKL